MISVEVNTNTHVVTMKGHAQHSEGNDVVCAAASMLFYTLAESLLKAKHMLRHKKLEIKAVSGDSKISCNPISKYIPNINLMLWVFCNGMQLLANNYPDCVELIVVGG